MNLRNCFAVACLIAAPGATAYDLERVRINFAHELAECSAYYTLIAEEPGIDIATSVKRRATGLSLAKGATDVASEEFVNPRIDQAIAYMTRDMKGMWKNVSIINDKYGLHCQRIVADPVARRKYWLDKVK